MGRSRKNENDKKVPVTIYLEKKVVDHIGGTEKLREVLIKAANNKYIKDTGCKQ